MLRCVTKPIDRRLFLGKKNAYFWGKKNWTGNLTADRLGKLDYIENFGWEWAGNGLGMGCENTTVGIVAELGMGWEWAVNPRTTFPAKTTIPSPFPAKFLNIVDSICLR